MKNPSKQTGSARIIVLVILVVVMLGTLGFVFWQNFVNKTDTSSNTDANASKQASVRSKDIVPIYPQTHSGKASADGFTVVLPSGWSVQKVFEDYDIVKTTNDGKTYLISSAIADADFTYMATNNVSSGEVIKTVKTSKGTQISIVQTPELLVLTTCKPTADDCYLSLNGKHLYIHLYYVKPGAQSASKTDYPPEIISDFEQIAESLNI